MSQQIPSNEECKEGAKLAIENAERHLEAAELLATRKLFGPAQSHLILSGEESIKALMLMYKSMGLVVNQEILNNILSHHIPRHIWAIVILLMKDLLSEDGINNFISLLESPSISTPEGRIPEADEFLISLGKESIKVLEEESYNENFNHILKFWTSAEQKKQQGFYLDYENKGWSTPIEITEEDYQDSYKFSIEIIEMASESIEAIFELSEKDIKNFKMSIKPLMHSWRQIDSKEI